MKQLHLAAFTLFPNHQTGGSSSSSHAEKKEAPLEFYGLEEDIVDHWVPLLRESVDFLPVHEKDDRPAFLEIQVEDVVLDYDRVFPTSADSPPAGPTSQGDIADLANYYAGSQEHLLQDGDEDSETYVQQHNAEMSYFDAKNKDDEDVVHQLGQHQHEDGGGGHKSLEDDPRDDEVEKVVGGCEDADGERSTTAKIVLSPGRETMSVFPPPDDEVEQKRGGKTAHGVVVVQQEHQEDNNNFRDSIDSLSRDDVEEENFSSSSSATSSSSRPAAAQLDGHDEENVLVENNHEWSPVTDTKGTRHSFSSHDSEPFVPSQQEQLTSGSAAEVVKQVQLPGAAADRTADGTTQEQNNEINHASTTSGISLEVNPLSPRTAARQQTKNPLLLRRFKKDMHNLKILQSKIFWRVKFGMCDCKTIAVAPYKAECINLRKRFAEFAGMIGGSSPTTPDQHGNSAAQATTSSNKQKQQEPSSRTAAHHPDPALLPNAPLTFRPLMCVKGGPVEHAAQYRWPRECFLPKFPVQDYDANPDNCIRFELFSQSPFADKGPQLLGYLEVPLFLFQERFGQTEYQFPLVMAIKKQDSLPQDSQLNSPTAAAVVRKSSPAAPAAAPVVVPTTITGDIDQQQHGVGEDVVPGTSTAATSTTLAPPGRPADDEDVLDKVYEATRTPLRPPEAVRKDLQVAQKDKKDTKMKKRAHKLFIKSTDSSGQPDHHAEVFDSENKKTPFDDARIFVTFRVHYNRHWTNDHFPVEPLLNRMNQRSLKIKNMDMATLSVFLVDARRTLTRLGNAFAVLRDFFAGINWILEFEQYYRSWLYLLVSSWFLLYQYDYFLAFFLLWVCYKLWRLNFVPVSGLWERTKEEGKSHREKRNHRKGGAAAQGDKTAEQKREYKILPLISDTRFARSLLPHTASGLRTFVRSSPREALALDLREILTVLKQRQANAELQPGQRRVLFWTVFGLEMGVVFFLHYLPWLYGWASHLAVSLHNKPWIQKNTRLLLHYGYRAGFRLHRVSTRRCKQLVDFGTEFSFAAQKHNYNILAQQEEPLVHPGTMMGINTERAEQAAEAGTTPSRTLASSLPGDQHHAGELAHGGAGEGSQLDLLVSSDSGAVVDESNEESASSSAASGLQEEDNTYNDVTRRPRTDPDESSSHEEAVDDDIPGRRGNNFYDRASRQAAPPGIYLHPPTATEDEDATSYDVDSGNFEFKHMKATAIAVRTTPVTLLSPPSKSDTARAHVFAEDLSEDYALAIPSDKTFKRATTTDLLSNKSPGQSKKRTQLQIPGFQERLNDLEDSNDGGAANSDAASLPSARVEQLLRSWQEPNFDDIPMSMEVFENERRAVLVTNNVNAVLHFFKGSTDEQVVDPEEQRRELNNAFSKFQLLSFSGFQSGDPSEWCDVRNTRTKRPAPEKHTDFGRYRVFWEWSIVSSPGVSTDVDGWRYAESFHADDWQPVPTFGGGNGDKNFAVRRRHWVARRARITRIGNEPSSSAAGYSTTTNAGDHSSREHAGKKTRMEHRFAKELHEAEKHVSPKETPRVACREDALVDARQLFKQVHGRASSSRIRPGAHDKYAADAVHEDLRRAQQENLAFLSDSTSSPEKGGGADRDKSEPFLTRSNVTTIIHQQPSSPVFSSPTSTPISSKNAAVFAQLSAESRLVSTISSPGGRPTGATTTQQQGSTGYFPMSTTQVEQRSSPSARGLASTMSRVTKLSKTSEVDHTTGGRESSHDLARRHVASGHRTEMFASLPDLGTIDSSGNEEAEDEDSAQFASPLGKAFGSMTSASSAQHLGSDLSYNNLLQHDGGSSTTGGPLIMLGKNESAASFGDALDPDKDGQQIMRNLFSQSQQDLAQQAALENAALLSARQRKERRTTAAALNISPAPDDEIPRSAQGDEIGNYGNNDALLDIVPGTTTTSNMLMKGTSTLSGGPRPASPIMNAAIQAAHGTTHSLGIPRKSKRGMITHQQLGGQLMNASSSSAVAGAAASSAAGVGLIPLYSLQTEFEQFVEFFVGYLDTIESYVEAFEKYKNLFTGRVRWITQLVFFVLFLLLVLTIFLPTSLLMFLLLISYFYDGHLVYQRQLKNREAFLAAMKADLMLLSLPLSELDERCTSQDAVRMNTGAITNHLVDVVATGTVAGASSNSLHIKASPESERTAAAPHDSGTTTIHLYGVANPQLLAIRHKIGGFRFAAPPPPQKDPAPGDSSVSEELSKDGSSLSPTSAVAKQFSRETGTKKQLSYCAHWSLDTKMQDVFVSLHHRGGAASSTISSGTARQEDEETSVDELEALSDVEKKLLLYLKDRWDVTIDQQQLHALWLSPSSTLRDLARTVVYKSKDGVFFQKRVVRRRTAGENYFLNLFDHVPSDRSFYSKDNVCYNPQLG
ncbi:unnamed protein product [Amoebophrya sp. A120]|nr:unnamed protein product [Amoebophrya sp. A120]|eukprot:GSA120T00023204001.1